MINYNKLLIIVVELERRALFFKANLSDIGNRQHADSMFLWRMAEAQVHAYDSICTLNINWPQFFNQDPDTVEAFYTKEEKEDKDIQREINAKKDHIRKLKATADEMKVSSFDIDLPFPVIETKIPDLKILEVSSTENGVSNAARILRVRLECKFDSTFAVSKVKEDVKIQL